MASNDLSGSRQARRLSVLILWAVPLVLALAGTAVHIAMPLNDDVAWFFTAAGRMLAGGRYSNDFFDMNMPMGIGIYIPAVWLQHLTGLQPAMAVVLWVFVLVAQSAFLSLKVASGSAYLRSEAVPSALWIGWMLLGLVFLPAYDFGEKEHLMVVLSLPFVLAAAGPMQALSLPLRTYLSVLAAVGFFLKPHFAGLPLLILLYRAWREHNVRLHRSVEAVTIIGVGAVYGLVVVLVYPDWFKVARWAVDLYGAYRTSGWIYLIADDVEKLGCVLAACLVPIVWRTAPVRQACTPWLLFAAYGLVAYVAQFKGWSYQFLPVVMPLFLACGLAIQSTVAVALSGHRGSRMAGLAAGVAGTVSLLYVIAGVRHIPTYAGMEDAGLVQALRLTAKGDYVYVFSTNFEPVFPTVVVMDRRWSSRFAHLWPLAGIVASRDSGSQERAQRLKNEYEGPLADAVAEDLDRCAPGVVLVDQGEPRYGLPPGFDLLGPFLNHPAFARAWRPYRAAGRSGDYRIYVRERPDRRASP